MTTGGQPTATAFRSSLAALARGAGIEAVLEPQDEAELTRVYDRILRDDGPFVVPIKVEKGRGEGRINRDVIGITIRFARALQALPLRAKSPPAGARGSPRCSRSPSC